MQIRCGEHDSGAEHLHLSGLGEERLEVVLGCGKGQVACKHLLGVVVGLGGLDVVGDGVDDALVGVGHCECRGCDGCVRVWCQMVEMATARDGSLLAFQGSMGVAALNRFDTAARSSGPSDAGRETHRLWSRAAPRCEIRLSSDDLSLSSSALPRHPEPKRGGAERRLCVGFSCFGAEPDPTLSNPAAFGPAFGRKSTNQPTTRAPPCCCCCCCAFQTPLPRRLGLLSRSSTKIVTTVQTKSS